jgi:limonene-1,2-epoxide hydrolase
MTMRSSSCWPHFFTDDAVYHNIPFAPVAGRKAIADNIASFIRPGPPGIERIDFRVINIAAMVQS